MYLQGHYKPLNITLEDGKLSIDYVTTVKTFLLSKDTTNKEVFELIKKAIEQWEAIPTKVIKSERRNDKPIKL